MKILLRFDDIAENMNWHMMDKFENLLDKYDIKPVMGVIPYNQDKDLKAFPRRENFWKIVKRWQSKGWEISMHGFNHLYIRETNKNDYFKYGGKSEFFGEPLSSQSDKINRGLKIFRQNNIEIRSFFAPNHTYDINTFIALKNSGIFEVIDGYGLKPYKKDQIKFIPQLFYKFFFLPFGLQTTQIHLNKINDKNFNDFKKFVEKKYNLFVNYDQALSLLSNKLIDRILNKLIYFLLVNKRKLFN